MKDAAKVIQDLITIAGWVPNPGGPTARETFDVEAALTAGHELLRQRAVGLTESREIAYTAEATYVWPQLEPVYEDEFRLAKGCTVDLKVRQDGEALRPFLCVYEPQSFHCVEMELEYCLDMAQFRDLPVALSALGDPKSWDETITAWFAHAIFQSEPKLTIRIGHREYQRVVFKLDSKRYFGETSTSGPELRDIGATAWGK